MIEQRLSVSTEPLLDTRVLGDFRELLGAEGPAVLRSIIDTYLRDTPPMVEGLGEALSRGAHHEAALLAHRLKSSSLSIGASRLAEHLDELEERCLARLYPPPARYAAVVTDFIALRRTLKTMLTELA